MDLKKILRIKEIEEREKARRLKEIEEEIRALEEEKAKYEKELESLESKLTDARDPYQLLMKEKGLVAKIEEIEARIKDLEKRREQESEDLREVKREEKAISILKDKVAYEEYAQSLRREFLQLGFIHLIKKGLKILLMFSIVAYGESAVQKKIKETEEQKQLDRLKAVEKVIDEKLRRLIEERKRLEALRRKPLTEEEEKEVQKLIKMVGKTPTDEMGAILNNVKPHITAEILIRLKDRVAGQILAAMDPKKAAQVTEIIMSWRRNAKKR